MHAFGIDKTRARAPCVRTAEPLERSLADLPDAEARLIAGDNARALLRIA